LGDVERICDQVVMVHGGQVLVQGPIAAVAGTTDAGFAVQLGANGDAELESLTLAGLRARRAGDELHVQGGAGTADMIRDVAADRGWALRRLSPKAPSLEETFLQLQAQAAAR
ncbi:MAG TPA: hypothetical protein VGA45_03480, partial [Actinomycetota bacterium]